MNAALHRLRQLGLVAPADGNAPGVIDAHPLVREHFGARLREADPAAWREGHRRLYAWYAAQAPHQPDTLDAMEPLFAAIRHGCDAGLHQKAFHEVYRRRVLRSDESFLIKKLGAFAANLTCLASFFESPWHRPVGALRPMDQAGLLGVAGFTLRAVGRGADAVPPMQAALTFLVAAEDWGYAANVAGNLSELGVALGKLGAAAIHAEEALQHADRSRDAFERLVSRTQHADLLHHLGRLPEARACFEDAERIQKESGDQPLLYSLRGFQYCDLFLGTGEAGEVLRRAERTIQFARGNQWLLDIALDSLSIGRAHAALHQVTEAAPWFREAIVGLRRAGTLDLLLRGLLARAGFNRECGDLAAAARDLDEIRTLVRRTGFRLFEADLALEEARLHLAQGKRDLARAALERGRPLVRDMSYGRREPEIQDLERTLA